MCCNVPFMQRNAVILYRRVAVVFCFVFCLFWVLFLLFSFLRAELDHDQNRSCTES